MSAYARRSFQSLAIPNYRRYFAGQLISLSGNWMQIVAEMWLILTLTGSAVAVGVTTALQFLPMLLFAAWGGLLADRFSKRRVLYVTQSLMIVPALALWGLTATGSVEPWMVFALVFARGTVNAVDNPTRQSFVTEMVGSERVVNAVGLNSALIHAARIFGPAGAGVIIATLGVAPCFLLNSLTFAAMIVALRSMDARRLDPAPRVPRRRGALRETLRHVLATPALAVPLAMMAVVGTLGFNFQVILPVMAKLTFDGDASAYTALAIAMAVGALAGSLQTSARRTRQPPLSGRRGARLRRLRGGRRGRSDPAGRGDRAGAAGSGERRLRGGRERLGAARRRADDARPGDGALLDGLPRLDADRRPDRGLAVAGREPPCGAADDRRGGGRRRPRRPPLPPPHPGHAATVPRGPASRCRPGVRTSFTGANAELGST